MWQFGSLNPFSELREQQAADDAVEWRGTTHPSMRIEAILSGQALAVAPGEHVQPYSKQTPLTHSHMAPFPHTVVVIKQRPRRRPEKRSRRVGRISRQFIVTSGAFDTDESEEPVCECNTLLGLLPCWWAQRKSFVSGPLIMC